jgi:hypothetical protein
MTIEKKSLISSLKATKKANIVTAPVKKEATTRKVSLQRSKRMSRPA